MSACSTSVGIKETGQIDQTMPASPICCKQEMQGLVRRAILHSDGSMIFCAVWCCGHCGRLLL